MDCPDENEIASYLGGNLDDDARRAVEAHVDTCSACTALLGELGRLGDSTPASYRAPRKRPEKVGRYPIEATLGMGGMGVVYRARDPALGRSIAIKVVRTSSMTAGRTEAERLDARLAQEAKAMASLAHPNVVPVYELGETDEGVFVAMELVEGDTSRIHLANKDWKEVLRVLCEAGEGLAAAHRAGVVHRDFKPENVLVGRDGRARVSDFGLAVFVTSLTGSSEIVGTAAYAAPEQLAGAATDPRADQYAFAVTLYEALFGERPFPGSTVEELRAAHARGPAALSSRKSAGVPAGVSAAVLRALSFDAARRFPTMRDLLDELSRARDADEAFHVRNHVVLQCVLGVVHAVAIVGMLRMKQNPSNDATSGPATPTGTFDVLIGAVVVLVLVTLVGWLIFGVVWAPLNAYGLARRRPFARLSTLVYGVLALGTCVGIPYGLYAIWTMTRPTVRAWFEPTA